MTFEDIMVQILHEVTGKPKSTFTPVLEASKRLCPSHRLDEELSPAEAEKLLQGFRQEKAGILYWLIEGNRQAREEMRNGASLNWRKF